MAEQRAHFAGGTETGDRDSIRADNLLPAVVHWTALSVGYDGPYRDRVKRSMFYRRHGSLGPAKVAVTTFPTLRIQAFQGFLKRVRLDIKLPGESFEIAAALDDACLHLAEIVRVPFELNALIVDLGLTDGAELTPFFIKNKVTGDLQVILYIRFEIFHGTHTGILRRGRTSFYRSHRCRQ